jgi:hypothetical protein
LHGEIDWGGSITWISHDLGDNWQFKRLSAEVSGLGGHSCEGLSLERLPHQLVQIAYDLETSVEHLHPHLPSEAIAAFWTSWRVGRHLAGMFPMLFQEIAKRDNVTSIEQRRVEEMLLQSLYRMFADYAREVRGRRPERNTAPLSIGRRGGWKVLGESAFWGKVCDHRFWKERRDGFLGLPAELCADCHGTETQWRCRPANHPALSNLHEQVLLAVQKLRECGMDSNADPIGQWCDLIKTNPMYFRSRSVTGVSGSEIFSWIECLRDASENLCSGLANQALENGMKPRQQPMRRHAKKGEIEHVRVIARRLLADGATHQQVCYHLKDAVRPLRAEWRHLTWDKAYMDERYRTSVCKWLSKKLQAMMILVNPLSLFTFSPLPFPLTFPLYLLDRFSLQQYHNISTK